MQYLVSAMEGPGFASPQEVLRTLEDMVLPLFEALKRLETGHQILAGGIPVGDRALVFIVEAASHDEVDRLVRNLPMWGLFKWDVMALQTFTGRAAQEREYVKKLTAAGV
ncbi:MAG: muconolactone Delta-isomerase family protein [Syntrophobacterales bacterium]|jgi:hypothetical protein|nr:muconolactone Delta-isomerase family protein [Syntrophobacterales bacterium]